MSNSPRLLLIGGGGHCRSCIDVIAACGDFHINGIVEAEGVQPKDDLLYPVIGFDSQLAALVSETANCLITIGQIKSPRPRQALFHQLQKLGANLPIIISPHSYVSPSAQLGVGTIVMHQALINAFSHVGDNCIVNSQALIEHDAIVGNHCHIATGAKINGAVVMGDGCFIGSGAVIKQGVTLGDKVIIGANSTVLSDISRPGIYSGVIK